MGAFQVEIGVGNPMGGDWRPVSALVATGATHSMMPAELLAALRLAPAESIRFRMANGARAEYGVGEARFRVEGQEWTCPVVFGPDDQYLLGATTLEIFGLAVDPVSPNPRLVPMTERYL